MLKSDGYHVVEFSSLSRTHIAPALSIKSTRETLERAAESLLGLFNSHPRLAVLGIPCRSEGDVFRIYAYLVEPAFRRDIDLLLGVDTELDEVATSSVIEPTIGYDWSLRRLKFLCDRYVRAPRLDGLPQQTPIESLLLDEMKGHDLNPEVQYGIGPFRVDFAFPEVRLAVEADGRAWHDAVRDAARDVRLSQFGWRVIRFSGSRIYRDASAVVEEIIGAFETQRRQRSVVLSEPSETRRSWWGRFLDWLFRRQPASGPDPLFEPLEALIDPPVPTWKSALDEDQRKAADASEGVVQVIAPAGSGKTRTMVTRVQELISRGVPATRILVTTFNRASVAELRERLQRVGVSGPVVKSFHGLGYSILKEEGLLRSGDVGPVSYAHWRQIAKLAMDSINAGIWLDPPIASELVSDFKLGQMVTPLEARQNATDPNSATAAEIYRIYEEALEEANRNDFDDLVIRAVWHLQQDGRARDTWQQKWECVLVDEYQDIEPAQELLIRMIAAPEDSIFVVGDEDQCIYSWRRASVERIVMLDTVYPGLERVVLGTSYRCPPAVTEAAGRLIAHNSMRFPKEIRHRLSEGATPIESPIDVITTDDLTQGADKVVELLEEVAAPTETVVLARTSRLLAELVKPCIDAGLSIRAPEAALRPSDVEETVLAYLRVIADPGSARSEDVRVSFRVPNRYLPNGAEEQMAELLRTGKTFLEAVRGLKIPAGEEWRVKGLEIWAEVMDNVVNLKAEGVVHHLRTSGNLDRHYSSVEQMTPHNQVDIEILDDLQKRAKGLSISELVALLEVRVRNLFEFVSEDGIELATIHGAKGREWDHVIVFGFDEDQLPHIRGLMDATSEEEFQRTIEDERRLAYVAMTRAKERLTIINMAQPSPFLREAGVALGAPPIKTFKLVREIVESAENRKVESGATSAGKPKSRPTTKARYESICSSCGQAIEMGATIVRESDNWVHEGCAA